MDGTWEFEWAGGGGGWIMLGNAHWWCRSWLWDVGGGEANVSSL